MVANSFNCRSPTTRSCLARTSSSTRGERRCASNNSKEFLETNRRNSVGTRNARLAAIKAFFRYLELRAPACLDLALQVRAIPHKHVDKPMIDWLDQAEMQAIPDAPDVGTVAGLRDRAMLHLRYAAGLRVSELTALTLDSLSSPPNSKASASWAKGAASVNCRFEKKPEPYFVIGWMFVRTSTIHACSRIRDQI